MNTSAAARPERSPAIRSRTCTGIAASLACLALVTTACSKSSAVTAVAALTSTASTASPASGSSSATTKGTGSPLAYSQCMRTHGIPDYPDPVGDKIELHGSPGSDLNPDSPQFQAAQKACQALQPRGGKDGGQADPKAQAQALKYAACMRSHGVPSFPDPIFSGGGIQFKVDSDPNSAQFQAAQKACQSLQPIGDGGGTSQGNPPTGGGNVVLSPSASSAS